MKIAYKIVAFFAKSYPSLFQVVEVPTNMYDYLLWQKCVKTWKKEIETMGLIGKHPKAGQKMV